jgi:hypothetical protein
MPQLRERPRTQASVDRRIPFPINVFPGIRISRSPVGGTTFTQRTADQSGLSDTTPKVSAGKYDMSRGGNWRASSPVFESTPSVAFFSLTGGSASAFQGGAAALSCNTAIEGGPIDNSNVGAAWVFLAPPTNAHDVNGDCLSDILWRDGAGNLAGR